VWYELGTLTEVEISLASGLSTVVNPDVIMSCLTHLPDTMAELRNTRSLACYWQTHMPDATSQHPSAVPGTYQLGTGGSYVEKPPGHSD
jgi:hypothetical protein